LLYSANRLAFTPPDGVVEGLRRDDLRKILPGCQQMAKVPNGIETMRKFQLTE